MPKKKAAKKAAPKKVDVFQKAYDTVTGMVQKSVEMIQSRFDEMMHDVQKRAFFFGVMFLAGWFFMFALSEFISSVFPWYGRTSGYLSVALILSVIALVFKKGMD